MEHIINKSFEDFKKYNGFSNRTDEEILTYINNDLNKCAVFVPNSFNGYWNDDSDMEDDYEEDNERTILTILHPFKRIPIDFWKFNRVLGYFNIDRKDYKLNNIDDVGRYDLVKYGKNEVSIGYKKTKECKWFRKLTKKEIKEHFKNSNKKPNSGRDYRPNELEFIKKKYLIPKLTIQEKMEIDHNNIQHTKFFG